VPGSGSFDLDLVFAPDGIESFEAAWREAANRVKDRETLPQLRAFLDYWRRTAR